MRRMLIYIILAATSALAACASAPSLVGRWTLKVPDGPASSVTVQDFGSGDYYLQGNTLLDGTYHLGSGTLTCVKPDDPRLAPFVFKLNKDGTLVLTDAPPVSVTAQRLLGSTLVRAGDVQR